jgi:uncharacterized membrane protein
MKELRLRRTGMWLVLVIAVLVGAAELFAQSDSSSRVEKPVNKLCPVKPDQPVDPDVTTTYQGRTIGFCCGRCLRKFEANPERYAVRLTALLADVGASEPASGVEARSQSGEEQERGPSQAEEHAGHRPAGGDEAEPAYRGDEHDEAGEHGEAESHAEHEADNDEEEEEHEHEHEHAAEESGVPAPLAWLGNFHPAAVNFPIAMLVGAAVAELLLMATKRQFFVNAGRFCLWFGGLAAIVAATLGWFFGGFHLIDDHWIMTTHRWLGTTTAIWALITLIVGERSYRSADPSRRALYRPFLFISAIAVLVTGFFGGAMLYGLDHYAL